jgi:hypothetical protein
VRITRPRAQRTLTAAAAGLALLATSADATTAGSAPCYYPCTGNNVKVPPSARLRLPNGGPISPSIGAPAAITVLSQIQRAYRHTSGVELATTPAPHHRDRRWVLGVPRQPHSDATDLLQVLPERDVQHRQPRHPLDRRPLARPGSPGDADRHAADRSPVDAGANTHLLTFAQNSFQNNLGPRNGGPCEIEKRGSPTRQPASPPPTTSTADLAPLKGPARRQSRVLANRRCIRRRA